MSIIQSQGRKKGGKNNAVHKIESQSHCSSFYFITGASESLRSKNKDNSYKMARNEHADKVILTNEAFTQEGHTSCTIPN